jgi:transposase
MPFIYGDRNQMDLIPQSIEDMVSPDDPVRAYDAIVGKIFAEISRKNIYLPAKTGAPGYDPETMLKVLVYSYSYGIKSSRKIERALYHNLSYIWLSGGLKPDHWTIANFRKENSDLIKNTMKTCVKMCIKLNLIEGNVLFVDGSKFRANASISNTWTQKRCAEAIAKAQERIDRLIEECDKIDKDEKSCESFVKLQKKLCNEKSRLEAISKVWDELKTSDKESINSVDSDSVKAKGRQGTHASYNVQLVTDGKNGLIVSAEAISAGTDYNQFTKQMNNAEEILEKKIETGCADAGYSSVDDLENIEKQMNVVVPSSRQMNEEREGKSSRFEKSEFCYCDHIDRYLCPNDRTLWPETVKENGDKIYRAKAKVCFNCKDYGRCTNSQTGRSITRLRNEEVKERIEANYARKENKEIYARRKEVSELPFGHMKRNLEAGQFLLRGLKKVNTETSLLATCFNVARMITLLGIKETIGMSDTCFA